MFWIKITYHKKRNCDHIKTKKNLTLNWLVLDKDLRMTCFEAYKFSQLKVQTCNSYKLYTNKYMIAPTKIKKTEIFAFIAVLVFRILSR